MDLPKKKMSSADLSHHSRLIMLARAKAKLLTVNWCQVSWSDVLPVVTARLFLPGACPCFSSGMTRVSASAVGRRRRLTPAHARTRPRRHASFAEPPAPRSSDWQHPLRTVTSQLMLSSSSLGHPTLSPPSRSVERITVACCA